MANDNAHRSKEADGSKELAPEVQDRIVLKFQSWKSCKRSYRPKLYLPTGRPKKHVHHEGDFWTTEL